MNANALDDLRTQVSQCQNCGLRQGCRQVVFGEGNPSARLVLIGEGPGADEDRLGRPPGNRAPTPEEREACWPNLEAQLRILQPPLVVLMGATALHGLIDREARITRMRGRWIEKNGVWYMGTAA